MTRHRLGPSALRLLAAALALLLLACPGAAEGRSVLILHTNDLHGHLEATQAGGLVRIATLVKQLRLEAQSDPEKAVLLLDAGDTSLGTPLSGLFLGLPTAEVMASLKYDAIALGNHEFNWGRPAMRALTTAFEAPVLCANLVSEHEDEPPPFPAFVVLERGGLRVGVVGLVAADTALRAPRHAVSGWRFLDPVEAARAALESMPEVDLLIALTHLGLEEDRRLAREVPGFDLIVGGHSHTPLFQSEPVEGTPIVQAGSYARWLGTVELRQRTSEGGGRGPWELVEQELLTVDSEVHPEPQAEALLEPYRARVAEELQETVAQLSRAISNEPAEPQGFRPLVKLVADALRAETGADVALFNRGGVRTALAAGPLTVGDVHGALPFDDPVVLLEMSGAELQATIEQGLTNGRAHLEVSGLGGSFSRGSEKPQGLRVAGTLLDPGGLYRVATTAFLAGGGDGMSTLRSQSLLETKPYVRELFLQYARRSKELSPPTPDLLLTE